MSQETWDMKVLASTLEGIEGFAFVSPKELEAVKAAATLLRDRLTATEQLKELSEYVASWPLELIGPAAAEGNGTLAGAVKKAIEHYQYKLEQAKIMLPALSIMQPWASAITAGLKHYETRGWQCSTYPRRIVLHAGKSERGFDHYTELRQKGRLGDQQWIDLPFGAIIGTAVITGCFRTDDLQLPDRERDLGDYSPGRWAFRLEHVAPLADPIPWQGAQGWFKVPQAVLL